MGKSPSPQATKLVKFFFYNKTYMSDNITVTEIIILLQSHFQHATCNRVFFYTVVLVLLRL